jgi:hypothetical protein
MILSTYRNLKQNIKSPNFNIKNKGQMSIFIIAGISIIVILSLLFIYRGELIPQLNYKKETNPNFFLDSCIENKIKEAVEIISSQGGYINNNLTKKFKFENEEYFTNISYLCYTHNYYLPCINQEPMLIQHLKNEIKGFISKEVKNCFDSLSLDLEKKGNVVDAIYNGFDIDLTEGKIIVEIFGKITLTKSGETSKQDEFKIIVPSKFYNLAIVAQEIISQEAKFCHFENLGFMLFYPKFNIDVFKTGDLTTIYTLEHKDSKEKFRFAIRTCIIPPGI